MNLPSTLYSLILFQNFWSLVTSEALASPIYEYLKDLCPTGQLPLTSSNTVRTCANICPLGSLCFRGICCVPQPQCRHPSYRISAGFPCLPKVKNNCPESSQCVASSQDGMYVCCSTRNSNSEKSFPLTSIKSKSRTSITASSISPSAITKPKSISPESTSSQICPASHPIIAHDGKSLVLCKDCIQGVCAKFRTSNVEVCCQNSDDICGPGSQVLMDGAVPRDCNRKPCGKGYECSLTPSGLRVCCSLARCPSGELARSVCAAGCLRNEQCVPIQNEMWCCPRSIDTVSYQCRDEGKATNEKCDPTFPACSQGAQCELNMEETAHICCKRYKSKLANRKTLLGPPPFYPTTKIMPTTVPFVTTTPTTTQEPFPVDVIPNCKDPLARPLMDNGLPYMCLHPGEPCQRGGYTCQDSDIDDVFVCCTIQNRLFPPQIPMILPVSTSTAPSAVSTSSELPGPTCPFSYMPSKTEHQEVQRCLTLFSLDCPFGYTCLPSSTTDSYLCCIRKPAIH